MFSFEPRSPKSWQVALDLFETTWEELIGQPSSVSADDVAEVSLGFIFQVIRL